MLKVSLVSINSQTNNLYSLSKYKCLMQYTPTLVVLAITKFDSPQVTIAEHAHVVLVPDGMFPPRGDLKKETLDY